MTTRPPLTLAVAALLTFGLAACTAPDTLTKGTRANSPAAVATPSVNPETDPAKLSLPLESLASFRAGTKSADGWTSNPMTGSDGDFSWRVLGADDRPITPAEPQQTVAFGDPATYTSVPGVLTFRGNNARNAPAYGSAEVTQKKLDVVWTQAIGEIKGPRFGLAGRRLDGPTPAGELARAGSAGDGVRARVR
ncbi:MAG: hypothetical protein IPL43_11045 [Micropruina sp.]|nr:hypothetical protein [Micropruina sp.]